MDLGEVTVIGGKNPNFERPVGNYPSFDGDITPEGFEAHYSTEAGAVNVGFHGGVYFLTGEDDSSKSIENLFLGQITATTTEDTSKLDLGLGAYTVDDSGLDETTARVGNSSSGVGYSPVFLDAALSLKTGPGVKIYGTYVNNQESSATKDTGYIAGIKFGSAKKGPMGSQDEFRSSKLMRYGMS